MRLHTLAVAMAGLIAIVGPTRAVASPPAAVAYDSLGPADQTQIFGVWMAFYCFSIARYGPKPRKKKRHFGKPLLRLP